MSATAAGWCLVALALALILASAPQAALVAALGALACALAGPTPEQRDARRRNRAPRRW